MFGIKINQDLYQIGIQNVLKKLKPKVPIYPDLPKFDFATSDMKKAIELNTKNGWALTGQMSVSAYRNTVSFEESEQDIDEHFMRYYTQENYKYLYYELDYIKETIPENYKVLIDQGINCFKEGWYQIAIPAFVSIIEGLIATYTDPSMRMFPVIREWQQKIQNESESDFMYACALALHSYIKKKLFADNPFGEERKTELNRHWVSHGRDNPNLWSEIDVIKLICVISCILFVFN